MSLENTSKFLLIDATDLKNGEMFDQLERKKDNNSHSYKERSKPLISRELSEIDQMMAEIVNNNSLNKDEKVEQYNNALTKYQSMKSTLLTNTSKLNKVNKVTPYKALVGIPEKFKKKANELLNLLQDTPELSVENNGEVLINNNTIPESNISDLLNRAVNPMVKERPIPGWNEFYKLLIKLNIPRSLINYKTSKRKVPSPERSLDRSSSTLDKWTNYDEPKDSPKEKSSKRKTRQSTREAIRKSLL